MVKRKIIWSQKAKSDLFAILEFYHKRNGTKVYSKKLNSTLRKSVRLLVKYAEIGTATDFQNVRNLIDGEYSIFYKIGTEQIEIITIWDNRKNPDSIYLKD